MVRSSTLGLTAALTLAAGCTPSGLHVVVDSTQPLQFDQLTVEVRRAGTDSVLASETLNAAALPLSLNLIEGKETQPNALLNVSAFASLASQRVAQAEGTSALSGTLTLALVPVGFPNGGTADGGFENADGGGADSDGGNADAGTDGGAPDGGPPDAGPVDAGAPPPAAPTVAATAATALQPSSATLNGAVNPNGATTTAWFRYSITNPSTCNDTFGTKTTNLSVGTSAMNITQPLTGLSPATTYYFCVVAQNAGGKSLSAVRSFATPFNIGETAILIDGDSGNGNYLLAQQHTLPVAATIQSLSFFVTVSAGNLRLGIYDATGAGGNPGALKAQTAELTPAVGWTAAPVVAAALLPAGTYWLVYHPSSNALQFRKQTTGSCRYTTRTYGPLPATFPTTVTAETVHWSFYATLQP